MPTCHKCRQKMTEGFTDLKFDGDGGSILVRHIPAFICSCGESQIKGSIAKYVDNIVNRLIEVEKTTCHPTKLKDIHIKEVALA